MNFDLLRLDNDRLGLARVPVNLGVIHQRQGNYEEAVENFQLALTRAEAIGATEIIIAAQQGLGAVYQGRGEYGPALKWLNEASLTAQRMGDKPRLAELLWLKAEALYLSGDLPQAIASATRAADLAGQLRLPVISYLALTTKGKCYLAQKNDGLAFQALSQAIAQVEAMRTQVAGGEQERQLFFENKVAPYELMVELLISQNKSTDVLLYAERAKGRVLLDVLSNGRVNVTKAMTTREKEEERRLSRTIIGLNHQIRSESLKPAPDTALLNNLNARLNSVRIEYEMFQNVLYSSHPELSVRRGQTPALNVNGIISFVRDQGTAFLQYVITKERVLLFVFTRNRDNSPELRVYPINVTERDLARRTNKFHQLMAGRNPVFADLSRELYDLLVKPAEQQLQGKTTLCIIPDGSLWEIPFQALQPKIDRYLLEDYAFYYAASFSVLKEMTKPKSKNAKSASPSLIAFGNPAVGKETIARLQEVERGGAFEPLPEAEAEVMALGRIFGPGQSRVFTGANADEKSFKLLAPTYQTIHLATHGVLDNLHPLYSYLLLSRADGDANEDGFLEAREIMNMDLDADLAVLSACETARGRLGAGEGVIGISWAFFVAGCRTTVVSQWKVSSASTSRLMVNLYKHLRSDGSQVAATNATALRMAALELMKERRYRHPFYWAGFVMIGSNEK